MSEYIYSVVTVAAALGLICIIAPDGVRSGLKKHMKLICSLCLLCVIASPLTDFLSSAKDFFAGSGGEIFGDMEEGGLYEKYESIFDSYVDGGYGDNIGEAVKDALYEKFSLPKDQCRIEVSFADKNNDGVREPETIIVMLKGASIFREPKTIEKFISELFGCDCRCAVD